MKKEISTLKLIGLHLYPGLLILALYLLITPTINDLGFPSLLSLMLSFLLVIIPFELGHLLLKARRSDSSLKSILVNEIVAKKKFLTIIILGIIASVLIAGLMQTLDLSIKENLFSWLPNWYFYDDEFTNYSKRALIITAILRIFVDGLIIPFTEEIYFRGYLLPRIKGNGLLVPIMASLLFTIYHFWQPWNYLSLLIISAILVFPAWYYKNYKISLYIHLSINLLGSILFLLMLLN